MVILISETTAFLCFLAYASFFEWTLHKYLMHTPFWQYPFRAHALVHHGLFRTGAQYFLPDVKIIRKVRFAWWNAPFIILLHLPVSSGYKERWTQTYWQAPCQRSSSTIFFTNISITACIFPNDAG